MSSIMRWRRGLVVAIGASCPERGGCDHHILSDGRFHRSDLPCCSEGAGSFNAWPASSETADRTTCGSVDRARADYLADCWSDRCPGAPLRARRLQSLRDGLQPSKTSKLQGESLATPRDG